MKLLTSSQVWMGSLEGVSGWEDFLSSLCKPERQLAVDRLTRTFVNELVVSYLKRSRYPPKSVYIPLRSEGVPVKSLIARTLTVPQFRENYGGALKAFCLFGTLRNLLYELACYHLPE